MEYPADVVKAANEARKAEPYSDYAALAYAIMEERERCAKIADALIDKDAPDPGYSTGPDYYVGYSSAAIDIAAAIRSGNRRA